MSSPAAEFSAAQAVAAGTDFAELKVNEQGLFWNEFRPADGACRIWHWHDQQARCLTPTGSVCAAGSTNMAAAASASRATQ